MQPLFSARGKPLAAKRLFFMDIAVLQQEACYSGDYVRYCHEEYYSAVSTVVLASL